MLFSSFKEIQDRCVFSYSSENPEDKYMDILFLVKRIFVFISVCGAVKAYKFGSVLTWPFCSLLETY